MKTIGILGGMSWESTSYYYQVINQTIREQLGELNSAKVMINSINFQEIRLLQQQQNWQKSAELLITQAQKLEQAGADFVLLATNTMHIIAQQIQDNINIPFLHIADATAQEIQKNNISKIGLLGTNFTMEQEFYKSRLTNKFNFEVFIPEKPDRNIVDKIIFDELCLGKINPVSLQEYQRIILEMNAQNKIEGVILGCTEITLLIQAHHIPNIKLFDTAKIHCLNAVDYAIGKLDLNKLN